MKAGGSVFIPASQRQQQEEQQEQGQEEPASYYGDYSTPFHYDGSDPYYGNSGGGGGYDAQHHHQQQEYPPPQSSECVVDSYAQSVLESFADAASSSNKSSSSVPPDTSLGPYVTSVVREALPSSSTAAEGDDDDDDDKNITNNQQQLQEEEEEALVELLQEHCSLSVAQAKEALGLIVTAVKTGQVPVPTHHHQQPPFLSIEGLETALPAASAAAAAALSSSSSTPRPTPPSPLGVLSPLHEDKLLTEDLLGALDDEENGNGLLQPILPDLSAAPPAPSLRKTEEEFPTLGQAVSMSSKTAAGGVGSNRSPPLSSSKPPRSGSKSKKGGKPVAATDLAAALFKSRREEEADSDERHGRNRHHHNQQQQSSTKTQRQQSVPILDPSLVVPQDQQLLQHQQMYYYPTDDSAVDGTNTSTAVPTGPPPSEQLLQSVVEILLSYNVDLSEAAAIAAAHASQADINVAQYLVDRAQSAPPICRHLLNDGCYRADCTYSHDLAGHTCLFWLRNRCGKGETCRFKHGFGENALKEIEANLAMTQQQMQQQYSDAEQHEPQLQDGGGATAAYGYDYEYAYSDPSQYNNDGAMTYEGGTAEASPMPLQPQAPSPSPSPSSGGPSSFANIATQGYSVSSSFAGAAAAGGDNGSPPSSRLLPTPPVSSTGNPVVPTAKIPADLWTPHEARDASAFHIADPMERYRYISSQQGHRPDVIDLHFQSTTTFSAVLSQVLPEKLKQHPETGVWIVTGTGHHVGSQTHQKGGGALESAVIDWLAEEGYAFARGKDRNGQGGAILVENG